MYPLSGQRPRSSKSGGGLRQQHYSKGNFAGLVLCSGFVRGMHTTPQAFPTEAFAIDEERIPQVTASSHQELMTGQN
jgi:hypothetical protein